MNYINHIKAGFYIVLAVLLVIPILRYMELTTVKLILIPVMIYFGSQFPDLDSWASKIRKIVFISMFVGLILIGAFALKANFFLIAIGLIGLVVIFSIHRKFFHTVYFGGLVTAPILFYDIHLAAIFLIAFMTHITTDFIVSKAKRQSKAFLRKHKTIANILQKIGLVKVKEEYQIKWLEKL